MEVVGMDVGLVHSFVEGVVSDSTVTVGFSACTDLVLVEGSCLSSGLGWLVLDGASVIIDCERIFFILRRCLFFRVDELRELVMSGDKDSSIFILFGPKIRSISCCFLE